MDHPSHFRILFVAFLAHQKCEKVLQVVHPTSQLRSPKNSFVWGRGLSHSTGRSKWRFFSSDFLRNQWIHKNHKDKRNGETTPPKKIQTTYYQHARSKYQLRWPLTKWTPHFHQKTHDQWRTYKKCICFWPTAAFPRESVWNEGQPRFFYQHLFARLAWLVAPTFNFHMAHLTPIVSVF